MPKRILIVEDETAVRRAIRVFLEHHRYEICGEAVNGVEAIEKAVALQPDLIILDLSMPLMNGIEAASLLKTKAPGIPVVIYTMLEDILRKSLATTLGVKGVVSKADGLAKLLAHIEAILDSDPSVPPHRRPHLDQ
jgi:DNA-binding NarL/FixJ family response regulator